MNKIFTCLIAAMLLYATNVVAQQNVTFTAEDATGDAGQQICVPITVTNFTDLVAFTFSIDFDPVALQFESIQNINLPNMTAPPAITNFGVPGPNSNVPAGKIAVLWDDNTFLGITRMDGEAIFEVCFTAVENSGIGSTTISFSETPTAFDVLDNTFTAGTLIPESGTVTINGAGGGTTPLSMSLSNATGNQNTQVCLDMSVQGFTDIASFRYDLTYDPARLQFASIGNYNLTDLDDNDITIPGENGMPPGRIAVDWQRSGGAGTSVPNGTDIFQVCFNILAASGTSTVSFSDDMTPFEVLNDGGMPVPFQPGNGTITTNVNSDIFRIYIPDATAMNGTEVCLDVKAEGFNDIISWQYHLTYDPSRLEFSSVGNYNTNLPGLSDQSITVPGEGVVQPGRIVCGWDSSSGLGVTLPDDATLFQLCFNVLGNGGTTDIAFTDDQLPFEVRESDGTILPFNSTDGTVTIQGDGNSDVFRILLPNDITAEAGTEVCMDVTVEGFNDIISWQYHLTYDPSRLQFSSVGNYNPGLPGLSDQSITVPGEGVVQPGRIVSGWDSSSGLGVTLPDGTAVFQLCFNVLASGGSADVTFSDDQLPFEVRESDGTILPFNFQNGRISIQGGSNDLRIGIADETIESGEQFCVDVTVDNLTNILGFTLGISYDPNDLEFVSMSDFNLPALVQLGTPTSNSPTAPGSISVVWFDQNLTGISRADGTRVFEICFNAIGQDGTTTEIEFTDLPPTLEMDVVNPNQESVPFSTQNGTITIGQSALTLSSVSITDANCFGEASGAIDIVPAGGSGNFSYNWSNGNTTEDLADVPAGSYSVTVTDNGTSETVTATYNVGQPSAALAVNVTDITNVDCNTTNTGSITISASGGTAPYTYNWSGTLPDDVTTQSNLAMGQYSVTVTDANNCTVASTAIDVVQNSDIQITAINPTDIDQGNDGAVNVSVSGGTGTLNYSWSGPGGFSSTQQNIANLSNVGQYCVTVTDNSGCMAMDCVDIGLRLKIGSVQIARACSGTPNGGISLTVTGGQPAYNYSWSNGSTSQNLSNVPAGNYSVTVTDVAGQTITGNFEVNELAPLMLTPTVLQASMDVNDGEVSLAISGGSAPYDIDWDNGATTARITDLAPGEYCVTVTDNRGCSQNACYTVPEQSIPLSIADIQIEDLTCSGGDDGALSFQIQGGRMPYSIVFSDGTSVQDNTGTVRIDELSGGRISYTVTDGAGATTSGSAEINEPAPMQITDVTVVHDTEDSGCTGRIMATVTGGTPEYLVQWNAPNTGTGTQIINLCEGTFVPTVRDANGCTQTFPGIEVNTFALDAQVTNVQCPQDQDGRVALDVNGGEAPYSYSWRNADNEEVATDSVLADVPTGVYTVRVNEASGNTLVRQFTVNSQSNLAVDVEVISDYNGSQVSCIDADDGIIEASGRNSDGNYTYEWRRGGTTFDTQQPVFTGASAGTYEVIVTDGIGCSVASEIEVQPPNPIEISANIRDISCPSNRDGEIIANAAGGATGRPYSYAWSNGAIGPRISFLSAGTYTVSATDANNCTASTSFTLEEPKPIQVQVQTEAASEGCDGRAAATVEGGTAPYTYEWNAPDAGNNAVISNLCPGSYFVRVTDSRGCTTPNMVSGLVEDDRFPCIETSMVMTPNDDGGDGLNDQFRVNCIEEFANTRLEVYNRWGQLVFEMDNYDNSWRGTNQNGDLLPEGPYYFVIEYEDAGGVPVQRKGSITLLRDN